MSVANSDDVWAFQSVKESDVGVVLGSEDGLVLKWAVVWALVKGAVWGYVWAVVREILTVVAKAVE